MEVVDQNPHNDTQSSSESSQSESEHEIPTNDPNLHSTMVSTQDELNERVNTQHNTSNTEDLTITQEEEGVVMEDTADTGGGHDHIMDRYIVPTHRSAVGDTNEPNSLVATFGTTEDFEVLLQQQLDEMNDDDIGTATRGQTYTGRDTESPTQLNQTTDIQWRHPGNNRQPTSKNLNSSNESVRKSSYTRPSPRNKPTTNKPVVKSRLKLSPEVKANSPNRDSFQPRESTPASGRNTSRSARSPAANRARRANDKTHGRESRLICQSSDDASIRSDVSRSELRSKLKQEAQSRKRDEEFVKQLQENYGELLMKYAEAENTIDHLRLGAKINIFASVPRPNPEDPTLPFVESTSHPTDRRPRLATVTDGGLNQPPQSPVMFPSDEGPSKLHASSAGSDKDSWVESSLQLPAAAAAEFLRVALQLQAKDLQDKIDSFKTLMKETELSPHEKAHAMENIEDSLHALERDYLNAVDEHAAEQRKLAMATGGSVEQGQPFDPGREMESDIFRLGQMIDGLKHEMSNEPVQQQ
uniref:AKNA domain-containing protein n=4 Tax=Ciona intestinalis TaxID=7719 RepID=F6W300_CIOIN